MRIRWTTNAANDLTRIVERIREESPTATRRAKRISLFVAKRVSRKMYDAIGGLRKFPQSGRVGLAANTRELVLLPWPYIAVYELVGEQVHVLRIRHASQDWP
jgi:plasmid stabilization system protein ParE